MFDEKFVLLVEEAVKEKDINHVVETNALKRKNDETEERRKKKARKLWLQRRKSFQLNRPICWMNWIE